jgi:hypothetical protein
LKTIEYQYAEQSLAIERAKRLIKLRCRRATDDIVVVGPRARPFSQEGRSMGDLLCILGEILTTLGKMLRAIEHHLR